VIAKRFRFTGDGDRRPRRGLGTVQATDKREAIEKAAKEFRLDPAKLMAEPRR